MNIYSWNVLFRNRELDRAFTFIAHTHFDIFCLQEVPEELLARLKSLPFHLAYRSDMEKESPSKTVPMYNVILSKHPITAQGEIPFADYWHLLPLRSRIFTRLMKPFSFSKVKNRGGLYADITVGVHSVRVFCLHLALTHPAARLKEFEYAMLNHNKARPTIVCGDFNILEKPHIAVLNWLLGGRMIDILLYGRERLTIEKRFVEHELHNPLRGEVTHALSLSQLDHILVSHSFSMHDAQVLPDRVGSDHHPIFVKIS